MNSCYETANKKKMHFIKSFALVMAMLTLFLSISVFTNVSAASGYTLYVNDEPWYTQTLYNWQKINQVYYVPISLFLNINGVEISSNQALKTVTISRGKKYMSIETENKQFAYTEESGEFYFKTYELKSGIIYVPASIVCNYFGFDLSIYGANEAIRICDGTQKLTFYETLLIHNPSLVLKESGGTKYNPIKTDANVAYFMFDDAPNENTDAILDLLEKYNCKATFFLSYSRIIKYPLLVNKIIINGHGIGLICDSAVNSYEEFYNSIGLANDALYSIAKIKTRITRISDSCNFEISQDDILDLRKKGYVLWDKNIDSFDNVKYASSEKVVQRIVEQMSDYKSFTVSFHGNTVSVNAFNTILRYIIANTDYKLLSINHATSCPFYMTDDQENE